MNASKATAVLIATFVYLAFAATAQAAPPTLSIDPVATHSITTAHVSGTVEVPADGLETYWCFEYSEEGADSWSGFCFQGPLQPGESASVPADLSGLKAETPYEVRLAALNTTESIEEFSPVETFTTDPATAPALTVDAPGTIGYTTAHLSGTIDPEGGNEDSQAGLLPIGWEMQVNKEGDGWSTFAAGEISNAEPDGGGTPPAASDDPIAVSADATDLQPGAEYKFRLLAHYAGLAKASSEGEFTTLVVAKPTISNLSVSGLEAEAAHFSADVNPNGTDPAFDAAWQFQCVPECKGLAGGTVAGSPQQVASQAFKLQANTEYTLTLTATNKGGSEEATTTFTTPAAPPLAQTLGAGGIEQTTATLHGNVNPRNSGTSYRFEWGTSDCSANPCQALPAGKDADAGSGGEFVHVSQPISGLTPGATYHLRLVAENQAGTTAGPDLAFTTDTAPSSSACPNEAIREEQEATHLPECRAFELVSPPDKNGGDIAADTPSVVAAADGGGIAYLSRASFGDTIGAGGAGQTTYLSRRSSSGWSTRGVNPTPKYDTPVALIGVELFLNFSTDLERVFLQTLDLPGTAAEPDTSNIYLEETGTRAVHLLSTPTPPAVADPLFHLLMAFSFAPQLSPGVSSDSRHLAFESLVQLMPEPESSPVFGPRVYRWDEGVLSLASVLPDGTPAPEAQLALTNLTHQPFRGTVSPDGTRVLFRSQGQLYMRIGDTATAWVSEPEVSGPAPTPEDVILQQVTGDSRHVIFGTTSKLLNADTNEGPDLYLYTDGPNPQNEPNLTLVTDSGNVPGVRSDIGTPVIGSSNDGRRIYYLVGETISLWEEGNAVTVAENVGVNPGGMQLAATSSAPGAARVTSDGRYLGFFEANPREPGEEEDLGEGDFYLFDAVTGDLRCASCPPSAETTGQASIIPNVTNTFPKVSMLGSRPRFLADDGRLFFTTSESLAPVDRNGVGDVYRFDPRSGETTLLSSGTNPNKAAFADASPSGGDVFIFTRGQLVASDRDEFVDLYDIRPDGGFSQPLNPTRCSGEACLSPLNGAPVAPVTSSSQPGPRNSLARIKRCRAGKHKIKRGGKARCMKRKKRSKARSERAAGTGGRAVR